MADIIHSSSRDILIRKIGYSAGLEHTRSRIRPLIDMYSSEHQISDASWTRVITDLYGRDVKAKVHFENFFRVIGVLRREQGRLVALQSLEALTILRSLLDGEEKPQTLALDAILLASLTFADGELFGNLLNAEFNEKAYESRLSAFRQTKLSYFYKAYRNESERRELHRCIDFKEMPKSGLRDQGRKGPFAEVREQEVVNLQDFSVELSEDWFRKVPGRRVSWARELSLWDDDGITDRGRAYVELLRRLMPEAIRNSSVIVVMPTDLEFSANFLTWALETRDLVRFDDVITGLGGVLQCDPQRRSEYSESELECLVRECKAIYSSNDIRFARIRKELPLPIFALVILGLSCATGKVCPSLEGIVTKFQRSNRGVLVRKSRNSLYSFIIASK